MVDKSTISRHVPLAPYTTFGIGGSADYFITAQSVKDIIDAIAFAKGKKLPFFILGAGANIVIGDKGIRGVVIKNEANNFYITHDHQILLTAESGALMSDLINQTVEEGLSGLEHFAGIPSTVGGALWQNLHFLSPDRTKTAFIGDIVHSATILSEEGDIKDVKADYFAFSYDSSILHTRRDIVLSAQFILTPLDTETLKKRVKDNLLWRQEKHPENSVKTSAGSVFKKIEGYGAGRLIEKVGLKGHRIGGAMVSPKHANFIINTGNATAKDVVALIRLIQKEVKEKLGLQLETEISLVGEF